MKIQVPRLTLQNGFVIFYFVVVAVLLSILAQKSVTNIGSDGVSYISIAQHYIDGHWKEAVNAYWSPMISWLLGLLMLLGLKGEVAFRVLAVVLSLTILIFGSLLVGKYTKNNLLAFFIFQLATLPMLINAVEYNVITPDLLVVVWMLTFAVLLARKNGQLEQSKKFLILLGVFCAIGFMVKSVLLPLAAVSLCAWFLFLGKAPKGYELADRIKLLAVPLSALLVAAAVWVLPLSFKYHHVTLGSSSQYSMSYVGPYAIGHPVINGLIAPPNSVAVTPWEDPTKHEYVVWSPLQSLDDFGFYVNYVLTRNVQNVFTVIAQLSPFLFGVLGAVVLLLIIGKIRPRHQALLKVISLVSIVLITAYTMSHISGGRRYLWSALVFSNLSVAILLGSWKMYAPHFRNKKILYSAALLFPVLIAAVWYPDISRATTSNANVSVEELAQSVKKKVEPRSRFASNNFGISTAVSYYGNFSGYGSTQPGLSINDPHVLDALKRNGIEYYLFIERPHQPINLSGFNVVQKDTLKFNDEANGFPTGTYHTYLVKLK